MRIGSLPPVWACLAIAGGIYFAIKAMSIPHHRALLEA
jgi:hypothetical protein